MSTQELFIYFVSRFISFLIVSFRFDCAMVFPVPGPSYMLRPRTPTYTSTTTVHAHTFSSVNSIRLQHRNLQINKRMDSVALDYQQIRPGMYDIFRECKEARFYKLLNLLSYRMARSWSRFTSIRVREITHIHIYHTYHTHIHTHTHIHIHIKPRTHKFMHFRTTPRLFRPLKLRDVTTKNRIVVSPM